MRRTTISHAIVALLAALSVAPLSARAQGVRVDPAPKPLLLIGAGLSFPSGGDFSDTYQSGSHAMVAVQLPLTNRYALRGGLLYALYPWESPRDHPNPDRHRGSTLAATTSGVYTVPGPGARPYVIAGMGYYRVRATWLRDNGTIEPLTTRTGFGYMGGVGLRVGPHFFAEACHDGAYRKVENWARFIPVSIGYVF